MLPLDAPGGPCLEILLGASGGPSLVLPLGNAKLKSLPVKAMVISSATAIDKSFYAKAIVKPFSVKAIVKISE